MLVIPEILSSTEKIIHLFAYFICLSLPTRRFPQVNILGHHLEVRDFQPFEQLSSTVDPASHLQHMLMS
jgi:hypothetical protein